MKSIRFIVISVCLLLSMSITCCSNTQNTQTEYVNDDVLLDGVEVGGMTRKELEPYLENCSKSFDRAPVDVSYDPLTWEPVDSVVGRKLDVAATVDEVMAADNGAKVSFIVITVQPDVSQQLAADPIVRIASFTTDILDNREARLNNIKLAAKAIHNVKIDPGREFSFNCVIGKRTSSKGYREAPIIIHTEDGPAKGMGVGGGICQLSTTVYNTAVSCGMEIIERHLHSKTVPYVPKGCDATVLYGKADLRFRNNREYTVMLKTTVTSDKLTVEILENRSTLKSFAIIRVDRRRLR